MTATQVQDTMLNTPDQSRSVDDAKKHSVLDLFSQAKEILTRSDVLQVAVQGPPHRDQSHDDEKPRETHPYVIGTLVCEDDAWLRDGRGQLVGAVIRHGEEVWMLVNPKLTKEASFLDHLRQACDLEGPQAYADFWARLEPEVRKVWTTPSKAFPNYFGKKERSK